MIVNLSSKSEVKRSTSWDHHEKIIKWYLTLCCQCEANIPLSVTMMACLMLLTCRRRRAIVPSHTVDLHNIISCLTRDRSHNMYHLVRRNNRVHVNNLTTTESRIHMVPQGKNHFIYLMTVVICSPCTTRSDGIPGSKRMACENRINSKRQSHNFSSVELVPGFT
jgi:hypothetical protein